MKKMMLIALSMVVTTMAFAHGGYYQQRSDGDYRQDMTVTHDIMHNTSIKETKTEMGMTFEITAESESVKESVDKRFVEEQDRLKEFFEGVEVSVESIENGVNIRLTSDDERTQIRLKEAGLNLIYQYIHAGFGGGRGYHCNGNRSGWRGGYQRGPGMMGGGSHHWW